MTAFSFPPLASIFNGTDNELWTKVLNAITNKVPASEEYSAKTGKIKVTTEVKFSETRAAYVLISAALNAKKPLIVSVGPKAALVALVEPSVEGTAKDTTVLGVIVPPGQYLEITTTGVEGEPTYSALLL